MGLIKRNKILRYVSNPSGVSKESYEEIERVYGIFNGQMYEEIERNERKGIEDKAVSYYNREIYIMTLDFSLEDWKNCRTEKYWRTRDYYDSLYFDKKITGVLCDYKKSKLLFNYIKIYLLMGKPKNFDIKKYEPKNEDL